MIIVGLVVGFYLASKKISAVTGKGILGSIIKSNSDSFAKCLTKNGAKMYGTEWCGFCKKQKELFGESFEYINYIDCDKNRQECIDEKIKGYPTWKINEESYSGVQSFEKLSQLTGCKF